MAKRISKPPSTFPFEMLIVIESLLTSFVFTIEQSFITRGLCAVGAFFVGIGLAYLIPEWFKPKPTRLSLRRTLRHYKTKHFLLILTMLGFTIPFAFISLCVLVIFFKASIMYLLAAMPASLIPAIIAGAIFFHDFIPQDEVEF